MELWMLALVPVMPIVAGFFYGLYLRATNQEVSSNE